jgi:hypothetical protein
MKYCLPALFISFLGLVHAETRLNFSPVVSDSTVEPIVIQQSLRPLATKQLEITTQPFVPANGKMVKWEWKLDTPLADLPSWLRYIQPATGSNGFAIKLLSPEGTNQEILESPPPADLFFTGFLTYDDLSSTNPEARTKISSQVVQMEVILKVLTPADSLAEREPGLSNDFNISSEFGNNMLVNKVRTIETITARPGDMIVLQCGTTSEDICVACEGATANPEEKCRLLGGSSLHVKTGKLVLKSPLFVYGQLIIESGATVWLQGGSRFVGSESLPGLVNNGKLVINEGSAQIAGRFRGEGEFTVGDNSGLVFALADDTHATPIKSLKNYGKLHVKSGTLSLASTMATQTKSQVVIELGAALQLFGTHLVSSMKLDNRGQIVAASGSKVEFQSSLTGTGVLVVMKGAQAVIVADSRVGELGGTALINQGVVRLRNNAKLTTTGSVSSFGAEAKLDVCKGCKLHLRTDADHPVNLSGDGIVNYGHLQLISGDFIFAGALNQKGHFYAEDTASKISFGGTREHVILENSGPVLGDTDPIDMDVRGQLTVNPDARLRLMPGTRLAVRRLINKGHVTADNSRWDFDVFAQVRDLSEPMPSTVLLNNAMIKGSVDEPLSIQDGTFGGKGSLLCNVIVDKATLRATGPLEVSRDLRLIDSSTVELLATEKELAHVTVGGSAILAGTLVLNVTSDAAVAFLEETSHQVVITQKGIEGSFSKLATNPSSRVPSELLSTSLVDKVLELRVQGVTAFSSDVSRPGLNYLIGTGLFAFIVNTLINSRSA